jgi:KaiC/GvpD/RAD55 family RecA-like ATPase
MASPFVKAEKKRSRLRLAIDGPTGSGKTYTALVAATALAEGGKIAVIDTERESASLYSDKFDFDTAPLHNFNPKNYIDLIEAAEEAGYAVIVIDSLSHAWEGEGGILDQHDQATKRQKTQNSYTAWADVTPLHRELIDAMLQSKCHIIATMRSKMDYIQEKDEKTGRTVIRKVGMAPIQRQGMEYEFTIVGDMDTDHNLVITKSRCDFIADAVEKKPDSKFFKRILDWLNSGAPETKPAAAQPEPKPEPKPEFTPAATKPAEQPKPANGSGKMSVADAVKAKSPGGKEFSTLTVDQLKQVKASTDPKVTPEMKQAAETLLKDVDDWKTWEALCDQAMEAQIETISLGAGTKWITLFQEMVKLQKQLDDLAIPETFR